MATAYTPRTDNTFWLDSVVRKVIVKYWAGEIPENRITDQHVAASQTLQDIALRFLYQYYGDTAFLVSLQGQLARGKNLSMAQMRGALNCFLSEVKQFNIGKPTPQPTVEYDKLDQTPQALIVVSALADLPPGEHPATVSAKLEGSTLKQTVTPLVGEVTPVVQNLTYTVVLNDKGEYRTLKFTECPESYSRRKGTQIVALLTGPDNTTDFTGFGFVEGNTFHQWKNATVKPETLKALNYLLHATTDQQARAGEEYAIISSRCCRCGRKLTVPASLHRGMGPECAKK